jgi:hypothetical protein
LLRQCLNRIGRILLSPQFWWQVATIICLVILLKLQIIWFNGSTTLKELKSIETEIGAVAVQRAQLEVVAAGRNPVAGSVTQADTSPLLSAAAPFLGSLDDKMKLLIEERRSATDYIQNLNDHWVWMVISTTNVTVTSAVEVHIRVANSRIQVLGLYVLPLLYGMLGSFLKIVQSMNTNESAEQFERSKPGPRLVMGAVAGPMIGMFIGPEVLSSFASQAAPFLVAFLGGYATDVFFAFLDKALGAIRSAASPRQVDPAADTTVGQSGAVATTVTGTSNHVKPTGT